MSGWESVWEAITSCDASRVADEVLRLDEAGRREVARELPDHIGAAREEAHKRYERVQTRANVAEKRARLLFVRDAMARGLSRDDAQELWWTSGIYDHRVKGASSGQVKWGSENDWIEPMRVAGAGTLAGAAAVATWLYRRDFVRWSMTIRLDPLLRVVAARPPEWQADLATRLALRLRGTRAQSRDDSAALALELLRHTGAEPPAHEPLIVAWVSAPPPDLRQDPLAGHLIPRLFEAEGVGRALRDDRLDPPDWQARRSWLAALRDLVDAGGADRELLTDGCLRRFLRGGSATDLRFFVRLHDLLDPAPHPERARDYLRLLPAAPGPVAELALRQLRPTNARSRTAAGPAGPPSRTAAGPAGLPSGAEGGAGDPDAFDGLSADEVNEAVAALLFRPEGKLVRAGLSWLDQAARDAGAGHLDHLAPALASAFLCESYEVRERSVRLALKHAGRFSPAGAEAVREAAHVLPPELAARLSDAYGAVEAGPVEADDFEAVPLPAFEPPPRKPFRPPMHNLVDTYNRLYDDSAFERWLSGFVRHPEARQCPKGGTKLYTYREWPDIEQWAEALLREAADPGQEPPIPEPERPRSHATHQLIVRTAEGEFETDFGRLPQEMRDNIAAGLAERGMPLGNLEHFEEGTPIGGEILGVSIMSTGNWGHEAEPEPPRDRLPGSHSVSPPHWAMLLRCAEVHAALKDGTLPPYLLATPTLTSGHLDPAELVSRLEGYERVGARALPADLQQALLRLPREAAPDVMARAGRLTSEAGATLARWLKGRPEPEMRVDWSHAAGDYTHDRQPGEHTPRLHPRIRLEPTGMALVDALLSDPPSSTWEGHGRYMSAWRLLLPSDREAVAMHFLPRLLNSWDRPGYFEERVGELCYQDGPVGEGLALLIAVLLTERGWDQSEERGQEPLLRAAARGCLPAVECGRQLGLTMRRAGVKVGRVRSALKACAGKGAHREVWQIMTGLLPVYLPGPGERPHSAHTQALKFAVEVAGWADARGTIPAVAEIATGKGSSGFVRAARDLHQRLDRP
ncbi:hypothetical protein [Nonomuraea jiangxiensis]|uniref:DUF7824 domain-containing protein n=1 Tax=Nonomuraea jiangxiensis TaxID=633440 RepID=A0A1G7ZKN4_9ACTN|nr:hypothetical protein [Nonomuraea jiangxiensis]SDH09302.1 hypothetical protein SAMN05421869_101446 [Nonomuraea jiangxiensis]